MKIKTETKELEITKETKDYYYVKTEYPRDLEINKKCGKKLE